MKSHPPEGLLHGHVSQESGSVCVFIVPAGRVVRRVVVTDLWMDCPRIAELNKEGRIRGIKMVVLVWYWDA
jgi:hypothetical protein